MRTAHAAVALSLVLAATRTAAGGFTIDESTGKVSYDYELELPRARGRYQPTVTLGFESRVGLGGGISCGYSNWGFGANWTVWAAAAPYLLPPPNAAYGPSRVTRDGTQSFVAWIPGAGGREGGVVAEIERGYMKAVYAADGGVVEHDAAGTRWVYNPYDFYSHRYLLDHVVDADGNTTYYSFDASFRPTGIATNSFVVEFRVTVPWLA